MSQMMRYLRRSSAGSPRLLLAGEVSVGPRAASAAHLLKEALPLLQLRGDREGVARAQRGLGWAAWNSGDAGPAHGGAGATADARRPPRGSDGAGRPGPRDRRYAGPDPGADRLSDLPGIDQGI